MASKVRPGRVALIEMNLLYLFIFFDHIVVNISMLELLMSVIVMNMFRTI